MYELLILIAACPEEVTLRREDKLLIVESSQSLFRMKEYLEGAMDMFCALDPYTVLAWKRVSKHQLVIQEIRRK